LWTTKQSAGSADAASDSSGSGLASHRPAVPAVGAGHDLCDHGQRYLARGLASGVQPRRHVQLLQSRHTLPLKLLQQVGYGIKSQKVTDEGVLVVLRSLAARPISIVVKREGTECKAAAYMTIAGERARFERAYVFAKDGFLLPEVAYVDLFGKRDDGSPVEERLQPE